MNAEPTLPDTGEPLAIIPEAPIHFGRPERQGPRENADRAEWNRDLEERKARATDQLAKRIEPVAVDMVAEIDGALSTLELAAQDFEGPNGYGKPNLPLIQERANVERLRRELAESEARLADLELRGDSVQRLSTSVSFAESQLQGLVFTAQSEAVKALARKHYAWDVPINKISREMHQEFALHASVISLKQFAVPRHPVNSTDVEQLRERLQLVGSKLAELREHLTAAAE
jgi:hypothetical protein